MTTPNIKPVPVPIPDDGVEQAVRLTDEYVATAHKTAEYYARKLARTLGLAAADVEDIRQDLLMEVLIRCQRFDSQRAAWITFVDLVVRHEADDLAARLKVARDVDGGSIDDPVSSGDGRIVPLSDTLEDTEGMASQWSSPKNPFAAVELAIDVERFMAGLPEHLHGLCRLLMTESATDAQRLSGFSTARFYRLLYELRMRLRAIGLGPGGTP